jgi:hypothetical protein
MHPDNILKRYFYPTLQAAPDYGVSGFTICVARMRP